MRTTGSGQGVVRERFGKKQKQKHHPGRGQGGSPERTGPLGALHVDSEWLDRKSKDCVALTCGLHVFACISDQLVVIFFFLIPLQVWAWLRDNVNTY